MAKESSKKWAAFTKDSTDSSLFTPDNGSSVNQKQSSDVTPKQVQKTVSKPINNKNIIKLVIIT